jgi:hypothetical protein
VGEDVDEGSFDFRIHIFFDVGEEDVNGKYFFDFFGADVVSIEGEVGEEVDLGCEYSALFGKRVDVLFDFVGFSEVVNEELLVIVLYLYYKWISSLEYQFINLELIFTIGL